jgi:hypothetical protein
MNSLIYIYSKFTEEFLLLTAASVFALLSVYCYYWVIQKRRLGVVRSQIPSSVVKAYLGQLIQEAESVRKQLFGMTEDSIPSSSAAVSTSANTEISPDLLAKISSLENQLKEKESLVVNINIEKGKLIQEIENLKSGPSPTMATSSNQNELLEKINQLEARLEEYSLFEEDLANLKRLQQENADLKKRISESGSAPSNTNEVIFAAEKTERTHLTAVPEPEIETKTESKPNPEAPSVPALDQGAIQALLSGESVTPPENILPADPTPAEPSIEVAGASETSTTNDQFENLVDKVESSLDSAPIMDNVTQISAASKGTSTDESAENKTDDELLKEFENLLNS